MIVPMQYTGRSAIVNGLGTAHVGLAANRLREPTYFRGELREPLVFREALAALYQVVVSDYKYRPRDRLAFFAWLEEQDRKFLAGLAMKHSKARARMEALEARLTELDQAHQERLKPFHKARLDYFNFIYEDQYELQMLLDPVVTVHPDEVSFEAFSRDESTYARLAVKHELFERVDEFECGTTNIDFSLKLHQELERMRTYRRTRFDIAPEGLTVISDAGKHQEKKIDLPDSWVMGFLQVHATMGLGLYRLSLTPVELYNVIRYLRRRKARVSPRALRFELARGEKVKVVLEPWGQTFELTTPAIYDAPKPASIRTWGRDRLRVLARLLPVARSIDVYLAGYGLPSIYVLDLGGVTFTLALSGWTDNDWTGGAKFDLLTRRIDVGAAEMTTVYQYLRQVRLATDAVVAQQTGLTVERCRTALSHLCQVGRAMYDLKGCVFRHRDLFPQPFSVEEALKAVQVQAAEAANPQAKAARAIFEKDLVRLIARRPVVTGYKLSGSARGGAGPRVRPLMHVDEEGRIIEASCTCEHHRKFKLTKGPCEHILALRLVHMSRLESERQGG
ncbi:MAG: SWIM zinc finger family protein [Planctomycetia bacterium]|nr:SWIM zinc finger family protein [Planctomycetia bacterium]